MLQTIKKLFFLISYHNQKKVILLLVMILVMALLDAIGVASIVPFIGIILNPKLVESNFTVKELFNFSSNFGVENIQDFFLFITILFFFIFIFSLVFKTLTLYFQLKFVMMREYSIGSTIIKKYFHQPYSWFLNRHTSDLSKTVLADVHFLLHNSFLPLSMVISNSFVIIMIFFILLLVNFKLALISSVSFIVAYMFIYRKTRKTINNISRESLNENKKRHKIINQAFNSIKEMKIGNVEHIFVNHFNDSAKKYAGYQSLAQIITQLPRFIMEGIAFGGVLFLIIFFMYKNIDLSNFLPIIALYVFAGYRLLPAFQTVYDGVTKLRFSKSIVDSIYNEVNILTNQILNKNTSSLSLKKCIILKNISYKYPLESQKILKNISLTIPAQSILGIVGPNGGGKSTLINIIIGLLEAQHGTLEIDGHFIGSNNLKAWWLSIGYVPQHIYLSDDTIAANIAFGVEPASIDQKALEQASKIANIFEFIQNELPERYQTIVGEQGFRLSGGQRQKIAVARALYHKPKVLILDEATSALDETSEKDMMKGILNNRIGLTVIIISHRKDTLKNCESICLIENGQLKWQGSFQEWLKKSSKI
jgi:ATP-binding cassette, subfamily B, bacterial PglK